MKNKNLAKIYLLSLFLLVVLGLNGFCDEVVKSTETINIPVIKSSATTTVPEVTPTIRIKVVGDVMLGSNYPKPKLPPDNGKFIFDKVKNELSGADLLIGNLEGTFTTTGKCSKKADNVSCFAFRMPMEYIEYLKDAGFQVMTVANNHARDFGEQGLHDTIRHLRDNKIGYVGPQDEYETITVHGVTIGVIGFYWNDLFNNMMDKEHTKELISDIKEDVDVLVAVFHGGAEGEKALHTRDVTENFLGGSRGNVVNFAHRAIDAGADVVIGSGPHVPRAMEAYKGHLIAYSLGNFCGYELFNMTGPRKDSLILEVELDKDGGYVNGRIIPVILSNEGVPSYDENASSVKLIKGLTKADFPDSKINISDDGKIKINE